MTQAEVSAVRTAMLTGGQSDPLERITEQVVLECREAVASCKHNVLSTDVTLVPAGMVYHAVAIIRYRAMSRFGLVLDHGGDSRLEEYRTAQRYLADVASCKVKIGRADAPEEESAESFNSPSIQANPMRFTRRQQDGI